MATYRPIPDRVRKGSMAQLDFNQLRENLVATDLTYRVDHASDGKHNALEVARAVGTVNYSGTYALEGFNSLVSLAAGHNPAVGTLILTLSAGYFSTPMVVQMTDQSSAAAAGTQYVSSQTATTLEVKLRRWSASRMIAADYPFCIRIHSARYTPPAAMAYPAVVASGAALEAANANLLIGGVGALRGAFLTGHTSAGAHNLREIAKAEALMTWDGAAYTLAGNGITAFTRVSAGVIDFTLSPTLTTRYQIFFQPFSFASIAVARTDIFDMLSGSFRIYIHTYDYATNNWVAGDCSFHIVVHST